MTLTHLNLLVEWMRRDFRVRYSQTLLGSVWALFQPLSLTAAFVFIFDKVANLDVGIPYASFVLPGMLVWTLFGTGVLNASNATANAMYIAAKASYPRAVAPIAASLLPVVDLAVGLVPLPILLAVQDAPARFRPLPFVAAVLGSVALSIGVGAFLSAVTIFVRDVRAVLPLTLQLLLLVTPVGYTSDRIPDALLWNPMATYVVGFRSAVLDLPGPAPSAWLRAGIVTAVFGVIGVWYYHSVENRFADVA